MIFCLDTPSFSGKTCRGRIRSFVQTRAVFRRSQPSWVGTYDPWTLQMPRDHFGNAGPTSVVLHNKSGDACTLPVAFATGCHITSDFSTVYYSITPFQLCQGVSENLSVFYFFSVLNKKSGKTQEKRRSLLTGVRFSDII